MCNNLKLIGVLKLMNHMYISLTHTRQCSKFYLNHAF